MVECLGVLVKVYYLLNDKCLVLIVMVRLIVDLRIVFVVR